MAKAKLDLKSIFLDRLVTGLKHSSITSPSKWATTYRYMNDGVYSFKDFPWAREMHDSKAEKNVGQKAAQMGFTEIMLNLAFFCIDILGKDVLYVLPTKNPSASNFSTGRFDPALELSPYLKNLFSDVDNVSHKRAGIANLYVTGSQSRTDLKSMPITKLFMDEVAEFVEKNIPLALERLSGQRPEDRQVWMISTPTMEGFGISKYYAYSDKKIFVFPCPKCSRHIDLKFPECLKIEADGLHDLERLKQTHLICPECKGKLEHNAKHEWLAKAFWQPTVANREWSGWTISQLYSTRIRPYDIAESVFKAQANPADEVELFNSKLGLPHEAKGARVNDADLEYAIMNGPKKHNNDAPERGLYTMGIDVGKWLHYEIVKWRFPKGAIASDFNTVATAQVAHFGKCKDFEDLDKLMMKYRIQYCVIDAQPEKRMALSFARRFMGRVHICYFGRGVNGRTIHTPKDQSNNEPTVIVDRSAWLDTALGRFINKTISLPIDVNLEYREHLKAPAKSYKKDEDGNPVARYLTDDSVQDHYAFARCYSEIALAFASPNFAVQNIEDF